MAYDNDLAKVLMTLNAFSYDGENPLPREPLDHHQQRIASILATNLANEAYETKGKWELVWGPGLTVGNMMYLTRQTDTSNYALSIRGTDWKFIIDWIEDVDILQLVPFPYIATTNPNVRIAKGTMDGLMALASMAAPPINPTVVGGVTPAQISLLQFLSLEAMKSTATALNVFVTGHSLGGALAAAVGPWLGYQTAQWKHTGNTDVNVQVYTFAGPSAGNADFAEYCGTALSNSFFRVYNTLDVVPRAWQQLGEVATWYSPNPTCPLLVKAGIDVLEGVIAHDIYTQAGLDDPLDSAVNASAGSFWKQLAFQHDQNTYLRLLGAPPVTIDEDGITARAVASLQGLANSLPAANLMPLRVQLASAPPGQPVTDPPIVKPIQPE